MPAWTPGPPDRPGEPLRMARSATRLRDALRERKRAEFRADQSGCCSGGVAQTQGEGRTWVEAAPASPAPAVAGVRRSRCWHS